MPDIFISPQEKKSSKTTPFLAGKKESGDVNAESIKYNAKSPDLRTELNAHKGGMLSSFIAIPDNVDFETRDEGEKLVFMLRKHPITNFKWGMIALLMLIVPIIINYFSFLNFMPGNFQFIIFSAWYLITMAFILENFMMWLFNVDIITNQRIIDVDFYNLIYKHVSSCNIDKVQDVSYTMAGVVRTIFNYGNVLIETAGEIPQIDFASIPHPDQAVKILKDLKDEIDIKKGGDSL
jgi:hypothetical protein